MDKSEAIERLEYLKARAQITLEQEVPDWIAEDVLGTIEAYDMAIEALQTEPTISKMEQVEDDAYFLKLMGAVERGEISDAGANQAWYEYINHKDEPQTMLNDGTLVINVEDATKVSRVLVGDDKNRGDLYYPDDEDETQTDCAWR